MLKVCPHCEIESEYRNHQQFGAHFTNCDKNPNSRERIKNLKKALNNIEKNKKYKYQIKCKQCDSDILFETTKHKFEIGGYSKFCSPFCVSQYSSSFNNPDELKPSECVSCGKYIKIKKRSSSKNSKCDDCKEIKILENNKLKPSECVSCGKYIEINKKASTKNSKCEDCKRKKCEDCNERKKCKCCKKFICKDERCLKFLRGRKKIFKKLGFNFDYFGNDNFHSEYDRICELLESEYENSSMVEIGDKYDINYQTIWTLMKDLKLKARDTSESIKMAIFKGRLQLPEVDIYPYKSGYHTTWMGDKVWFRSSYELDYCNKLDDEKIRYKVEPLRIKYWDSQENIERIAIPDFLLLDTNTIVEIKSSYTYDPINMIDKFESYRKNGYNCKLILDNEVM